MSGTHQQLCLFKFQRPLEERLGKSFFKEAPKSPGVYVFRGNAQKVLYVGQSKNLKQRLAYYKNAQPEREPSKIIKLVRETQNIEIVLCPSAAEAQLRETQLIQHHRPKFNVANAKSVIYSFFTFDQGEGGWELALQFEIPDHAEAFGAFRNRGLCRRVLFSLGRFFWLEQNGVRDTQDFPLQLMNRKANRIGCERLSCEERREQLKRFFSGEDAGLLDVMQRTIENVQERFTRTYLENDLLCLTQFYEFGAIRNRQLRERFGLQRTIGKTDLDPLSLRQRLGI